MAVARKLRMPDMISLSIVLGVIGVLCIVVRFAAFRHITFFEGPDAVRLGAIWLCLSVASFVAGIRSMGRTKERDSQQKDGQISSESALSDELSS